MCRRYLLPLILLFDLSAAPLSAQPSSLEGAPSATAAARQRAVESGLLPYVPVAGMPGWNLRDRMRFHRVPGVSIAVVHNYKIDWVAGYGLADTLKKTPVTPQTLFSAGSVSKLVTAVAALKLAQDGVVALDAPINTYLNSWQLGENERTRAQPVTLRLLLSHRAGTSQSSYWGFAPRPGPYPSVPDILAGKPGTGSRPVVVNQPIGAGFSYSGGGYLVAQQALTDATGQAFTPLTAKLLFKPLAMTSATFQQPLPPDLEKRAAWGYSGAAWYAGTPYVYPQQAPAGLYATPTDLARILIEIQNALRGQGKVLNQPSARTLVTPLTEISNGTFREQMGLGAFLLQRADRPATEDRSRYFEHTGRNAGFMAFAMGSVTGGNGVVVMLNDDGGANELAREIRRAVAAVYGWPDFLPPAVVPVPTEAAHLAALAGRYQRGPDELVTFRAVGSYLQQTISTALDPGRAIVVVPQRGDTVAFTDFPMRAVFVRDAGGAVSGYRMLGAPAAYPRLPATTQLPHELLRAARFPEAIEAYRALHQDVNTLTYAIYEFLNHHPHQPTDSAAAEALLTLAEVQFPGNGQVLARRGDVLARRRDLPAARAAYQQALALNPDDEGLKEALAKLGRNKRRQ